MTNVFKAISWKAWLSAFFVWFFGAFVLLFVLEGALRNKQNVLVSDVLPLQVSMSFDFFRHIMERPIRPIALLFYALFCPVIAVPILMLAFSFLRKITTRDVPRV